jgi:hypothetical protein
VIRGYFSKSKGGLQAKKVGKDCLGVTADGRWNEYSANCPEDLPIAAAH